MGKINWTRVILGGLVAGLIINAFEYLLNAIVLAKDWASVMTGLGKTGEMSGASIVLFNVWGFLLGIAAVWLYAAIRPRYGAGLTTALCAGSAIWFVGIVLASVTPLALGLFPTRLVAMGIAVGFIELALGTTIGAWLYREESVARAAKA
jgi:hypothetical protein